MIQDITAQNALEFLKKDKDTFLIDVRTEKEQQEYGFPLIESKNFCSIDILSCSKEEFCNKLNASISNKSSKLFFICKLGVRSRSAAEIATNYGYKNCFNIIGGYEQGWKISGLPCS